MVINANTKISALIKENPAVIDVITSINSHFKKLHNPLLRKILASRVTIHDAARIGKCTIETFYKKLQPLGFAVGENAVDDEPAVVAKADLATRYDVRLDVRDDINDGKDPFLRIMQAITALPSGKVLLLINSFEPIPLICILKEKGYAAEVVEVASDVVYTYFKQTGNEHLAAEEPVVDEDAFALLAERYAGKLQYIDVRQLPMPQPMVAILKALDSLGNRTALYVYHKKVPLFLLPELKERQFETAIRHTAEGVELIIYR